MPALTGGCDACLRADNSFEMPRSRATSEPTYFPVPTLEMPRSRVTSEPTYFPVPTLPSLQDDPQIETVTHSLDAPPSTVETFNLTHTQALRTSQAVENTLKRKSSCLTTDVPEWHRPVSTEWLKSIGAEHAEPELFDFIDGTLDESQMPKGCSAPAC